MVRDERRARALYLSRLLARRAARDERRRARTKSRGRLSLSLPSRYERLAGGTEKHPKLRSHVGARVVAQTEWRNSSAERARLDSRLYPEEGDAASAAAAARGGGGAARTVVIMPFFASTWDGNKTEESETRGDSGHSAHELRRLYLRACFWSCHAVFPHVVAAVATREDYDFVAFESGLPFFDVLIYSHPRRGPGVPKPSALGIATVLAAQHAVKRQRRPPPELRASRAHAHGATATSWADFEHVYFTESDQVIHLRNLPRMLALASRKGTLVIPHRIVPMPMPADYSDRPELLNFEKRWHWTHGGAKAKRVVAIADEGRASCCFDRGDCSSRKHWVGLQQPEVSLFTVGETYALVGGDPNFLRQQYRHCRLNADRRSSCPPEDTPPSARR